MEHTHHDVTIDGGHQQNEGGADHVVHGGNAVELADAVPQGLALRRQQRDVDDQRDVHTALEQHAAGQGGGVHDDGGLGGPAHHQHVQQGHVAQNACHLWKEVSGNSYSNGLFAI